MELFPDDEAGRKKWRWMWESSTFQAILAEGRAEGRAAGNPQAKFEGRLFEARRLLLLLSVEKLGTPRAPVIAMLESIDDLTMLEHLIRGIDSASTWHELLAPVFVGVPRREDGSGIIHSLMTRPRVLLLGTGGAANECRRQACLLVERADRALPPILLDTGNGLDVVRALLAAGIDPLRVQDVFVSHRHADHAGGLDPLLLWRRLRIEGDGGSIADASTRIYAEPRVIEAFGRFLEATASGTLQAYGSALAWQPLVDGQPVELPDGGQIVPFLVDHAPVDGGALGCVVEVDGLRIAYSGDTRPCARLVEAVRGVHLLFHEAGGLDQDADVVHRYAHSTAGDAGRAARAAGVGRLYLMHLPDDTLADALLAEAEAAFGGPVGLATDMGSVDL